MPQQIVRENQVVTSTDSYEGRRASEATPPTMNRKGAERHVKRKRWYPDNLAYEA